MTIKTQIKHPVASDLETQDYPPFDIHRLAKSLIIWFSFILKSRLILCIFAQYTVCPRSTDPFYIVTYYIEWVTTSWTYSS